jgi:nicotinamide riboside kinase
MLNGKKIYQLKNSQKIIVVTGAESTGKSALTEFLAEHYKAPSIPEFARNYIEHLGRKYTYADVEFIARKQVEQLEAMKKIRSNYLFADTWLIITEIWFEEVYGHVPDWIGEEIKKTEIDVFLVCDTDLPWIPDNVRENGGERRIYLQNRYIENIKNYGFNFHLVKGINHERFKNALEVLEQITMGKPKHS